MKQQTPYEDDVSLTLPGLYDGSEATDLWFLPDSDGEPSFLSPAPHAQLVKAEAWRDAEARLAAEIADLAFDAGRLAEKLRAGGEGTVQRLALEEAAAISWWTGDRIGADRLALWLSFRIGATDEDAGGLIRTAWAARRLMAAPSAGVSTAAAELLDETGRKDGAFADDVAGALAAVTDMSPFVRGCAAFHLWRSLDERPEHLRGLEAAVFGARVAGQGGLPFLPLALTGFGALTSSGPTEARLAAWTQGAQRAVLSALMGLDRLASWRARAETETGDLSGRTPSRLIAALIAHPMLGAVQAEAETGASRSAVLRNLDLLERRDLVREVTGQGRFRVWTAKL